jgi:hypothetical protein
MNYQIIYCNGSEPVFDKYNIEKDPIVFYNNTIKYSIRVGSVYGKDIYYAPLTGDLDKYDLITCIDRNNPLLTTCSVRFILSKNNKLRNPFARLVLFLYGEYEE